MAQGFRVSDWRSEPPLGHLVLTFSCLLGPDLNPRSPTLVRVPGGSWHRLFTPDMHYKLYPDSPATFERTPDNEAAYGQCPCPPPNLLLG